MARSLWEVFLSLFDRRGASGEDAKEDDTRFTPSPLDLSIRFAHGSSDEEIERELSKIDDRARELEENRREK